MTRPTPRRLAPLVPADGAAVFLIGMRINRLTHVWRWLPVLFAMPRMIRELVADPTSGLVGRPRTFVSGRTILVWQQWASVDHLVAYARSTDRAHLPAWQAFNRSVRGNGAVGIFHETYLVDPSTAEGVYVGMEPLGLVNAWGTADADGARWTAEQRRGRVPRR